MTPEDYETLFGEPPPSDQTQAGDLPPAPPQRNASESNNQEMQAKADQMATPRKSAATRHDAPQADVRTGKTQPSSPPLQQPQSRRNDVGAKDDRGWWQKKRFIVPIGFFVLIGLVSSLSGSDPEADVEVAASNAQLEEEVVEQDDSDLDPTDLAAAEQEEADQQEADLEAAAQEEAEQAEAALAAAEQDEADLAAAEREAAEQEEADLLAAAEQEVDLGDTGGNNDPVAGGEDPLPVAELLLAQALIEWFDPAFDVLNGDRSEETCTQLIATRNQNDSFRGWRDAGIGTLLESDLGAAELVYIEALTACSLGNTTEVDAELARFAPIEPRTGPPSSWS